MIDALGGGPLVSPWQAAKLQRIANGEFSAQFALSLALKDVHLALQAAGDDRFAALACLADEWQHAVDQGLGEQDLTIVTRALDGLPWRRLKVDPRRRVVSWEQTSELSTCHDYRREPPAQSSWTGLSFLPLPELVLHSTDCGVLITALDDNDIDLASHESLHQLGRTGRTACRAFDRPVRPSATSRGGSDGWVRGSGPRGGRAGSAARASGGVPAAPAPRSDSDGS